MAEFEFTLKTDLAPIRDGTVVANFDEALAAVRQIVAPYQNLAVTPDTVREAAGDRAKLRKLRDRIDDQRKAVKAAYMAPVDAYTAAAKPILDEIDAALDDRNVERFANYLRNLSVNTQFIVITHRRGTMEASDVLYGVTMQEQGVSKLLRLDLNQMEQYLGIVE